MLLNTSQIVIKLFEFLANNSIIMPYTSKYITSTFFPQFQIYHKAICNTNQPVHYSSK